MDYIELSGVASVLMLGASLAAAAAVLRRSIPRTEAAQSVLRYTAYLLLAIGLLGVCLITTGAFSILSWPFVMGVWLRAAMQYRATQKRNLLGSLAVAVGRRMPLAPMALAFANEQERSFASRARAVADKLERGVPVDEVFRRSRAALPPESALAAAIGLESGDMASALDATTYAGTFDRTSLQPAIARILYLFVVVSFFFAFLSFMQLKIMPSWVKILEDFEVGMAPVSIPMPAPGDPQLPDWLVRWLPVGLISPASFAAVFFGILPVLVILFATIGLALLAVYIWLQWRGTLVPRLPGLRPVINWADMAPVLRLLALAARRGRPLTGTLCAIARYHPKWNMRRRAWRVVYDLDNGIPWYNGLRRCGLIGSADAAILAATERTGSLPWALVEMADGFERRATYRLQALAQLIIPLLLLPLGVITALIASTYFMSLAAMIENLT